MAQETPLAAVSRLLDVENVNAGYGPLQVHWGVSLHVRPGEMVALVGPNGAGKTTLLRVIAGLLNPSAGTVRFRGLPAVGLKANQLHRQGLSYLSETLNLFPAMSVRDNLLLGAYTRNHRDRIAGRFDFAFRIFPVLKDRLGQMAGTLSGGEQRMVGLARAFISEPVLLLVDEPSLGLSPHLVQQMFAALEMLNREGLAILVVEQNIARALRASARAYVLEQGRIVLEGASSELLATDHVRRSYLGEGALGTGSAMPQEH